MKIRVIIYSLLLLAAAGVAFMRINHTPQAKGVDLEYYVPKSVPGKPQMAQMMDPVGGGSGGGGNSVKSPTVVDVWNQKKDQANPAPPKAPNKK